MNAAGPTLESENLWGYAKRLRFVRRSIGEAFPNRAPATLRVLDVGCGNGSQLALALVKDGFDLTGMDTDARSIEHARQLATGAVNARFLCQRVEDLVESEPFDVVILSEVLEHLTEPQTLLAASMQRLRDEGILIVTVPNGYGEFEIDSWIFRTLHLQRVVDAMVRDKQPVVSSTDNQGSGHVQFFTRRRLRRLFDECGLMSFLEGTSSLWSGPMIGHVFGRSENFIEWNARASDSLPPMFASAWFFALRRQKEVTN